MGTVERERGVVAWFNDAKGYGFIKTEKGDYFVHFTNIRGDGHKSLNKDDEVEFQIEQGRDSSKMQAVDVVVVTPYYDASQTVKKGRKE